MAQDKGSVVRTALIAFIGALLILLIIIVVNVAGLSLSSTTPMHGQKVLWRGDDTEDAIALASAYNLGQKRAAVWASDAQLVRADAAWRPTREGQKSENPPVSWSFYYYSSQKGSLASALVTGDQVFWTPPIQLNYKPKTIVGLPSQDVDIAWLTFRAAGGDEFLLRHKDAMITFRLSIKNEALVWTVSAFDEKGNHSVVLDAHTGTLVTTTQN